MSLFSATGAKFSIGLFGLYLVTTYDPVGPIPEDKKFNTLESPAWTQEQVDEMVEIIPTKLASPAPAGNGSPPEQCDYVTFNRIKLKGENDASSADAAFMMMPGFIEGATIFNYLGKNLVYKAKVEESKVFEVWALDRRNNCLEDGTGFNYAETLTNIDHIEDSMIGYYYENSIIDGKNFGGFYEDDDLSFLSEFGVEMDIKDMHLIATTLIPDQSLRKQKLYIGGHSQGGPFAAIYAGWDFDGDSSTTNDAGYNNVAGLFGFDTSVRKITGDGNGDIGQILGGIGGLQYDTVGRFTYRHYLRKIRKRGPRILPIPGLTPEILGLTEAIGLLAHKAPDSEHTALDRIPRSSDLNLMLRAMYSRTYEDFLNPPDITDFRFTNEALMGFFFDENFSLLPFIHASFGHLSGGSVVQKRFPFDYPILRNVLNLDDTQPMFIGNDAGDDLSELGTGPLYTWANYDEIGSPQDPEYRSTDGNTLYTSLDEEMVDSMTMAQVLYEGESNLTEWYYSTRRLLDIAAIAESYAPRYGLNYIHSDKADTVLPTLDFVAENSNSRDDVESNDGTHQIVIIPGMEHLDPMLAVANQPDRYENSVIQGLIDFVE